jgi:hypothetical protein
MRAQVERDGWAGVLAPAVGLPGGLDPSAPRERPVWGAETIFRVIPLMMDLNEPLLADLASY